jgi:uncharacterized protein YjbI with pentapeptide repeats
MDIAFVDLSNASMVGTRFMQCQIGYTDFTGADLRNSRWRFLSMEENDFQGADFQGAKLALPAHVAYDMVEMGADLSGAQVEHDTRKHSKFLSEDQ